MFYSFRHVARFICLLVTMHIFALTASAEAGLDADGYDVELDGDAIFSNSGEYSIPHQYHITHIVPVHHHNKKLQTNKHVSFKTILSEIELPQVPALYYSDSQPIVIPEEYTYLFFKEINPPPPKAALA